MRGNRLIQICHIAHVGHQLRQAFRLSSFRRGLTIFSWGGGRSDVMFTRLPTFSFNKNFETNVIFMYVQNVAFNFHFEI